MEPCLWVHRQRQHRLPLTLLFGRPLLVGRLIHGLPTRCSIGALGVILIAAIVASDLWRLASWGLFRLENATFNTWLPRLAMSFLLAIGLS